jgi:hypothetical protein
MNKKERAKLVKCKEIEKKQKVEDLKQAQWVSRADEFNGATLAEYQYVVKRTGTRNPEFLRSYFGCDKSK